MLQANMLTALGTMSGTSLDGVDAAVITTDGVTIGGFGPSDYRPYTSEERETLRRALGRWQTDDTSAAQQVVEAAHIALMQPFGACDMAGFHGQTLAHDPGGRGTHQCGDGLRLAIALGYPVAWDFRTADVTAGGQGAPLAPFFHFALAKWLGEIEPIACLNLGGVGNVTWIDPSKSDACEPGAILAFDTGPANAPINDAMKARFDREFDTAGEIAAQGRPDAQIVQSFLENAYFTKAPPKSLDRDAFAGLAKAVSMLRDTDAIATLTHAVVASVVRGITQCPQRPAKLLVTGGGRHNATIMQGLTCDLDCDVVPVEQVGLNGDMLEAQAFAYLAVRVAKGLPLSAPLTTGVPEACIGGRIAMPNT